MNAVTEAISLSNTVDMTNFWMPFTGNHQFKAAPRILKSAKDMHFTTMDGQKVLDASAGLWCVNAGHGRAGQAVIHQCGDQNAQHDGPGFAKTCRQHQREQLRLVAHLGERDDGGRNEKGFHGGGGPIRPDGWKTH